VKLPRRKPDEPPVEIRITVPPELIASLKAYCRFPPPPREVDLGFWIQIVLDSAHE